jgi:glycosyltransferase involved in cell wall biosynthesis
MRVLYFTRDYTPHDHRFLTALAESGQETFYLRLERRSTQLEGRPLPPQVRQVPWRGGKKPFAWRELPLFVLELRRIVRELKPDVIHAGPVQLCAYIAALAGVKPLVSMSWGSDMLKDAHSSRRMEGITRYTLRRSRALVADCRAVQQAAAGFGFPAERVVTFPWGVDLRKFSPQNGTKGLPDLRARLGWGADCFVVLSLRSWEPIYGVDVVVKAFAQAAAEEPGLRLLLLGGGSLAGQIQGLLHEYQLHDRVHLGGQTSQDELARAYHAADLYVSASHSDGSSVSLMEALACGLPVLVSDIPGNREWIEDGKAGWLFPDGDAAVLAQRLLCAVRGSEALPGSAPFGRTARGLA